MTAIAHAMQGDGAEMYVRQQKDRIGSNSLSIS